MLRTTILIAAIENFVLFGTFLALGSFTIALVIRQLTIRQIWRPRAEGLAYFYTAALVIPPLASLWLVSAALFPRLWMTPEAFAAEHAAPLHEIHLLGALTLPVEPALAYGMALFVVVIAAGVTWSNIRRAWSVGRVIKQLDMKAVAPPSDQVALVDEVASKSGISVGLVMSDYPLSFVWGFRHSKLILSSGLLHALTPAELTGVLEHEAAHHERRDNLIKLSLSLCSYSSLAFPLSRTLVGWRATEVEMICDEVAAWRTSEPLEIAEALVKLRRKTMAGQIVSEPIATHALASGFVSDSALTFQRRVDRLLTLVDAPIADHARKIQSSTVRAGAFLFGASLVLLSGILLYAPLSVHHATETLIEIFR
ncbi:MAG TPA: M56 family metallopeptidase [Pyrinomonadaceae bacterium]|nr:M56 family metallopeptidase [Pyrinomonadaceae bacterium]